MATAYEQTQTLTVLDMESGKAAESSCTLSALRDGKPLVLDLWHTKCVRCPEALTKLDGIAGSGKHPGVVFAACALSLCDKPDPPKSEEAGREAVIELVDDMWDNLKHCYMTAEEKVNPAPALFHGTRAHAATRSRKPVCDPGPRLQPRPWPRRSWNSRRCRSV